MSTTRHRIVRHHGMVEWTCQLGEFEIEMNVWYRFAQGEPATDDTPAGDDDIVFKWARVEKMNDEPRPVSHIGCDWFALSLAKSRREELEEMITAKVLGY